MKKAKEDALIYLLITVFGGWVGAHYFYKQRYAMGLLYLFTGGLFTIGWIIDSIKAFKALMDIERKEERYQRKTQPSFDHVFDDEFRSKVNHSVCLSTVYQSNVEQYLQESTHTVRSYKNKQIKDGEFRFYQYPSIVINHYDVIERNDSVVLMATVNNQRYCLATFNFAEYQHYLSSRKPVFSIEGGAYKLEDDDSIHYDDYQIIMEY